MTDRAPSPWRLCVAPMMQWTDRHYRYLARLIAPRARLYTEMVVAAALVHGDRSRFLAHDASEHPLALQLGGSDPRLLAQAARIGAEAGYDEINLNIGCPSDRVRNGRFGACLMAEPALVADCVAAMRAAVGVPVTVKTRLGIDDLDSTEHLAAFIDAIAEAGCRVVILHARKAWLNGLSPHENRTVPPLRYGVVYDMAQRFPQVEFVINGGITDGDAAASHLARVSGVMLGRAAYHDPMVLARCERACFAPPATAEPVNRERVVERYADYVRARLAEGVYLRHLVKPLLGLFHARPHAREWRRCLSEGAIPRDAGIETVFAALEQVRTAADRRLPQRSAGNATLNTTPPPSARLRP